VKGKGWKGKIGGCKLAMKGERLKTGGHGRKKKTLAKKKKKVQEPGPRVRQGEAAPTLLRVARPRSGGAESRKLKTKKTRSSRQVQGNRRVGEGSRRMRPGEKKII